MTETLERLGMAVCIGNDVVDLGDPEVRAAALHPRFDQRAFQSDERAGLGSGASAHVRRWTLWAAKEAAYKALRQEHPALVFVPGRFAVTLDASGKGLVTAGGGCMPVQVRRGRDFVHAIALRDLAAPVAGIARCGPGEDPSAAVRRIVLGSLPAGARVDRVGRIPRLRDRGRTLPLSLSHHGRFVAFARLAEAS